MDRAALDVALKHGIECGGWCPAGRVDENGVIPPQYPVRELRGAGFAERTRQNVIDSDATVIFCRGEPHGGTAETIRCCAESQRPYVVIDEATCGVADAAAKLTRLFRDNVVDVLNVAGPRESEWPGGYGYASRVLERFFASL